MKPGDEQTNINSAYEWCTRRNYKKFKTYNNIQTDRSLAAAMMKENMKELGN